jgi:glycosyltransferase involved in cell wall biosynthesis
MSPSISVIVPSLDEQHTIVSCVQRIFAVYPQAEVVVVEGRGEGTARLLTPLMRQFPKLIYVANQPDLGKGHAVSVGLVRSSGELVAIIDADLQFHPEDLPKVILPLLRGEADLVLGSRFSEGSERRAGSVSALRTAGNWLISLLASQTTGYVIKDALGGLKAWRRSVTDSYVWQSLGFSYEVELPVKAARLGFRLIEVPVATECRSAGESSVRVWKTGVTVCVDMLRFRLLPLSQPYVSSERY